MALDRQSSGFTKGPTGPLGPALIGALLRLPWERVRRHMIARLYARGFDDLDVSHLNLFLFPGPHGLRPSELALRVGASKQSVNHLLGQLERLGYLERRGDSADLRSRRIHLTARGQAAGRVMREAVKEVEKEWGRRLGSKRLELLRGLLTDLCDSEAPRTNARRPAAEPG